MMPINLNKNSAKLLIDKIVFDKCKIVDVDSKIALEMLTSQEEILNNFFDNSVK